MSVVLQQLECSVEYLIVEAGQVISMSVTITQIELPVEYLTVERLTGLW